MPDKRMRPIVKQEPGGGDAQQLQAAAAATGGSRQRRRGDAGEEGAGAELELQLLRANAEAQAFALQGMERERALGEQLLRAKEELLQAKVQVAELRAEIRIKDAVHQAQQEAKDAVHKAEVAVLESKLQSSAPAPAPAPAMGGLLGSALLQRVGDGNKAQQFAALLRDRLPGRSYRLLHTRSRDGRSAASFHQRCDNQVRARAFARAAAARLTAGAGAHARHRALHHGPHVRRPRKHAVAQRTQLDQCCGMLPVPGRKSLR